MKPTLEKIEPIYGNSFTVRRFNQICQINKPHWHFHPEYEIVFISNGRGKRHIGDHISYYDDGDLIFLGPNLPHLGFTEELREEHIEVVVQMRGDFLGQDFLQRPEMAAIRQMFERSHLGLTFSGHTKWELGQRLINMVEMQPFDRLIELLSILQAMALSDEYKILNANGFAIEVNAQDRERMEIIFEYVEENFQQLTHLDAVAAKVSMTVPAFCRYFKKLTNKTFTQFVNDFRITHARRLLMDDNQTIAGVSYESGFNNLSHFNKQFREITGVSPREYRKNLMRVVTG